MTRYFLVDNDDRIVEFKTRGEWLAHETEPYEIPIYIAHTSNPGELRTTVYDWYGRDGSLNIYATHVTDEELLRMTVSAVRCADAASGRPAPSREPDEPTAAHWQPVTHGTRRLPVPGGWLYATVLYVCTADGQDDSPVSVSTTFVPTN